MQDTLSKRTSMRIIVAVAIALTTLVSLAASPVRAAEDEVVFDGAGWGHGVGMSQYGAYGRALDGQKYTDILTADGVGYYQGAEIEAVGAGAPDPGSVFTSVASDITATTLSVLDGPLSPHSGMVITRHTGEPEEPTATLFTGDQIAIVDTTPGDGAPDGCEATLTIGDVETIWERGTCDFSIGLTSGSLVPNQIVKATNCRISSCTFGYGTELHLVDNASSQRRWPDVVTTGVAWKGFDMVVEATLDEYTRGIAEVPFSWSVEALRSQAVAARSYAASFAIATDHTAAGCFCDVTNSSAYQVYAGWLGSFASNSRWDQAARDTAGEVLTHAAAPQQGIVRAFYSSSNGGASESSKDKWGSNLPYLTSVPDPYSLIPEVKNPLASWTSTRSATSVVDKVWGASSENWLTGAEVIEHNTSGSAKTVRFTALAPDGSITTKDLSSKAVTSAFGLYSWYFDVLFTEPTPPPPPPPISFTDIDETVHKVDIEYLAGLGVAIACDDGPNKFCPEDRMRREDLAAFMVRALDLPATSTDYFLDDDGLPFEDDINSLAAAGITKGCNPPTNDRFCPDSTVTRGQTAAFIVRAWHLVNAGAGDRFIDDDRSVFEGDIDRLAFAGITKGCNPPSNTRYCPDRLLTRAEMSSFLARALRDL